MFQFSHSYTAYSGGSPSRAIKISNDGLVCGAGSKLVRMTSRRGHARLLIEDDAERLIAMLSAARGRPVAAHEIVPHVRAAGEYWARGDKALANLRLIFPNLPQLRDEADGVRLRLAEYVLDQGFAPDALMKELGFPSISEVLHKYREDQPRVPAGSGDESGRWTQDANYKPSQSRPVRLAEDLPAEDEKQYEERRLAGQTSRQEDIQHGHGEPLRIPRFPAGVGPGPFASKPIPVGPGPKPGPAVQRQLNAEGREHGCHTCGTKDPGTPNGNFIGDHQPPTALISPGEKQYYFSIA